jgi:hypothetical protein
LRKIVIAVCSRVEENNTLNVSPPPPSNLLQRLSNGERQKKKTKTKTGITMVPPKDQST